MPYDLLILDVIKSLAGAFFGATLAFAFERWKKNREERNKRMNCCRITQFGLFCRVNTLNNILRQYLTPQQQNLNRWAELLPTLVVDEQPGIPLDELSFLLDNVEPNLLRDLYIAQTKYATYIQIIRTRDRLHEDFQVDCKKGTAGENDKVVLTQLTDELYDEIQPTIDYLTAVHDRLAGFMRKVFPGCNVLTFEMKDIEQTISQGHSHYFAGKDGR
jgi:hypothetical protein